MPTRFSCNTSMPWPVVVKSEGSRGIEIAQVLAKVIGFPEDVTTHIWGALGSTFCLGALLLNK